MVTPLSLLSCTVRIGAALVVLASGACRPASEPAEPAPVVDDRSQLEERFLEMFSRAYYPGRSGQIMLVPEPGDVMLEPDDPFHRFMHGSPWEYDIEIPLLMFGPGAIRPGIYNVPATQRDVAPTVAALLGVPTPITMSGRVLSEALREDAEPPRAILVAVLDGARRDLFDRRASTLPTLSRLKSEGAWIAQTTVDYLPSLTSVGHASIATGAEPRVHGVVANTMFDHIAGRPRGPYPGLTPTPLLALTIADLWSLQTHGRAVIIAQGTTPRATIPLGGHGRCLVNGHAPVLAIFDAASARWLTNEDCYRLPPYVADDRADRMWQRSDGGWLGHEVSDGRTLLRSGWFPQFQADALVSMIEREAVGRDDIADLILVNFKTLDYVAHRWGPDSDELAAAATNLDRALGRILAALTSAVGAGRVVVVVVSDHGMPGEPAASGAERHYITDVVDDLHARFDPDEARIVQYYGDPADNQIFIDRERLEGLGFTLAAVADHIAALPFIFSAYTEDEVAAASRR